MVLVVYCQPAHQLNPLIMELVKCEMFVLSQRHPRPHPQFLRHFFPQLWLLM